MQTTLRIDNTVYRAANLVYAIELPGENRSKAETARKPVTQGDPWLSTQIPGSLTSR